LAKVTTKVKVAMRFLLNLIEQKTCQSNVATLKKTPQIFSIFSNFQQSCCEFVEVYKCKKPKIISISQLHLKDSVIVCSHKRRCSRRDTAVTFDAVKMFLSVACRKRRDCTGVVCLHVARSLRLEDLSGDRATTQSVRCEEVIRLGDKWRPKARDTTSQLSVQSATVFQCCLFLAAKRSNDITVCILPTSHLRESQMAPQWTIRSTSCSI